jgi:hypothetical protein
LIIFVEGSKAVFGWWLAVAKLKEPGGLVLSVVSLVHFAISTRIILACIFVSAYRAALPPSFVG